MSGRVAKGALEVGRAEWNTSEWISKVWDQLTESCSSQARNRGRSCRQVGGLGCVGRHFDVDFFVKLVRESIGVHWKRRPLMFARWRFSRSRCSRLDLRTGGVELLTAPFQKSSLRNSWNGLSTFIRTSYETIHALLGLSFRSRRTT